jgi:integrase
MSTPLSDAIVRSAKPAAAHIRTLRDGHPKSGGLELRVFPSGQKSWAIRYRIGRRQRRLTLGDANILPLGGKNGARELARQAMLRVSNGEDPAEAKREHRDADTVEQFAEIYMERHAKTKKKSWRNDRAIFNADILPLWRHRLLKDIMRRDVRELLNAIVDRGAPIHANRVRACLSKLFKFAITEDVIEANPVADVPKPSPERVRQRVLSVEEIRVFWEFTETMAPKVRALWRSRLLTAQRPQGEVAQMQWGELDLDGAWWTIPTTKSKNRLEHRVPLSATVVKLLREIRPEKKPKPEAFVFAGITRDPQVRSGTVFPLPDFQPRDLRKTARTRLAEDGVPEEWCEAVLNHKRPGLIGTYNLHRYDAEKRQALDHWSRRVEAIVANAPGARVLPFAKFA